MKKLLYILFCITLVSCNSKTEEIKEGEVIVFSDNGTTIYENDIYEVINGVYEGYLSEIKRHKKDETLYLVYLLRFVDFEDTGLNENGIKNYLKNLAEQDLIEEKDIEFIHQQVQNSKEFELDQNRIKDFELIRKDTLYQLQLSSKTRNDFGCEIINRYGYSEILTISLPLFTIDKNTIIVSTGLYTLGGRTTIYKKENGKWIWVKDISMWIS
jgi:hypothetical protein